MKKLKSQILSKLIESEPLKSMGFRVVKGSDRVEVRDGDRILRYTLIFRTEGGRLIVWPDVGIRFESVERIFHVTSGFSPKDSPNTATLGASCWQLLGCANEQECQYSIRDVSEVSGCVEWLASIFRQCAAGYYLVFGTIEAAEQAVNSSPHEECIHRRWPWLRCSTGMILAKFVSSLQYDHLKDVYSETMRHFAGGFYYGRFEALLKNLREFPTGPK